MANHSRETEVGLSNIMPSCHYMRPNAIVGVSKDPATTRLAGSVESETAPSYFSNDTMKTKADIGSVESRFTSSI